MNKYLYIGLLILAVPVFGQNPDSLISAKMKKGEQYLKGYALPYNPAKAYELFMECANMGHPKAMNALGILLMQGNGVAADKAEAFRWFMKAAGANYAQAWYNVGIMYKYGDGTAPDFTKAYESFKKAADLNNPNGLYSQGYMLYKGLGCQQDYGKAVALFKKGIDKGSVSSMYFLGLCYRNGYGLAQHTDSARFWLQKASQAGYVFADDELAAKAMEINPAEESQARQRAKDSADITRDFVPVKFKKLSHFRSNIKMDGQYEGFVVKYDYSGRHIISKTKLKLILEETDKRVTGYWTEEDGAASQIEALNTDSALVFISSSLSKADRYSPDKPIRWEFSKARLKMASRQGITLLAGTLQLFSPETMEPEKPIYISLRKSGAPVDESASDLPSASHLSELVAFPNPFRDEISVSFELKQEARVVIRVFHLAGTKVFEKSYGQLQKGKTEQILKIDAPAGTYILNTLCNGVSTNTLVVKQ